MCIWVAPPVCKLTYRLASCFAHCLIKAPLACSHHIFLHVCLLNSRLAAGHTTVHEELAPQASVHNQCILTHPLILAVRACSRTCSPLGEWLLVLAQAPHQRAAILCSCNMQACSAKHRLAAHAALARGVFNL